MSSHHKHLRDTWRRDGWHSDRTCLDAFEAAAAEHSSASLTFVTDDSVRSPTVGEIRDQALVVAASLQRLGCAPATRSPFS
jgi:non-ribosomal peptide synthetase component E (peptide arylation enzyme)